MDPKNFEAPSEANPRRMSFARRMTDVGTFSKQLDFNETKDKKKEQRIKPPEHSFLENDFTFEQSIKQRNKWIDCFFLYSLVWAFGSILNEKARHHFNTWLHEAIESKDKSRRDAEIAREDALLA